MTFYTNGTTPATEPEILSAASACARKHFRLCAFLLAQTC